MTLRNVWSRVFAATVGLTAGCGDAGNDGAKPQIYALTYSPSTVDVGNPTSIYGDLEFRDPDGDVTAVLVSLTAPGGEVVGTAEEPVGDPYVPVPRYQGFVSFTVGFTPSEVGLYRLDVVVRDSRGNASNHLGGDVAAQVPRVCSPGSQTSCACAGGAQGYQVCANDGSRYGECFGCPGGPIPGPDGGAIDACTGISTVPPIGFDIVDAEYDLAQNRIIFAAQGPSALHVYEPVTGTDQTVALPTTPTAVSVDPTGTHAAVGHNGAVSYVDLATRTVIATWPVSTDAIDVVLAGNGFAYVFPRTDQWEQIRTIQLSTGAETLSATSSIYAGTVAKLAPGKLALYGADNGLSPSDIEKYDITSGTATVLYDSPYHGDYQMCGDLWMSQDGTRIFTRCGNVFRASDLQADDMTYAGALTGLEWIVHLSHSSATSAVVAVGGTRTFGTSGTVVTDDTDLRVYTGAFFNPAPSVRLPCVDVGGAGRVGHGRFAFIRSDGSEYYVVVGADNQGSPPVDFAITRIPP